MEIKYYTKEAFPISTTVVPHRSAQYKVNEEGFLHSLDGPAAIFNWDYTSDTTLRYYIKGYEFTKDNWEIEINRLLMLNEL